MSWRRSTGALASKRRHQKCLRSTAASSRHAVLSPPIPPCDRPAKHLHVTDRTESGKMSGVNVIPTTLRFQRILALRHRCIGPFSRLGNSGAENVLCGALAEPAARIVEPRGRACIWKPSSHSPGVRSVFFKFDIPPTDRLLVRTRARDRQERLCVVTLSPSARSR